MIGGYANGKIRLYDLATATKLVEVDVHARPVTALDVAPATGLVSFMSLYRHPFRVQPSGSASSLVEYSLHLAWDENILNTTVFISDVHLSVSGTLG